MKRSQYILGILAVHLTIFSFGQDTGPGGVGTSSNLQIWLDASQLGLINGDPVGTWSDASGNTNNATGLGAARPTYLSSGLNGMPSVSFDGGDEVETGAIAALNTSEVSWFTVCDGNTSYTTGERRGIIETETDFNPLTPHSWGTFLRKLNGTQANTSNFGRDAGAAIVFSQTTFSTSTINNAMINSGIWRASDDVDSRKDGVSGTTGVNAGATGFSHIRTKIGNRVKNTTEFFHGEIPEVIVFNEEINITQDVIISNYLAGKYGITLGADLVYTHGGTHKYEIAGIGCENSATSDEHLSARGTGVVAMTSTGITTGAYLMWGHDNGGLTNSATNVPSAYSSTGGLRLDQEWILSEVGEVGTVTISFDLTGIGFGLVDSDYELLVDLDADGDFTNAQTYGSPSVLGSVVSFTVDGTVLEDGYAFTIGNAQRTIISIATGQDWNEPTTWNCTCVPSSAHDVTIDAGHTVTVSNIAAQTVDSLYINATGILVIGNGGDFGITGNVDCDGTFTVNTASKITLNGTNMQTLDFTGTVTFDSLEVDNPSNVLLNTGTFSFASLLLSTSGDVDFNGNPVTFLSAASGTAAIGPISGTISGLTNVISQRYIEAGVAEWSEFAFPFSSDFDLTEWDDEIFMSGPTNFADGCAYDASGCFRSAVYYDAGIQDYVGIDDATMPINQCVGIDLFLGDNLNTWSAKTLSVNGRTLNLTPNEIVTIESGWNYIGNPFLCPIDWDLVTIGGSIENYFWIYDAEDGWVYYDISSTPVTTSANLAGGIISAYQGFWVYNPGGSSTITFSQSSKSYLNSDAFVKSAESYTNELYFETILRKNGENLPPSRVYLDLGQEKSFHSFPKLPARFDHVNMYMIDEEGEELSSSTLGYLYDCKRIPLRVEGITEGDYTLTFENVPDKNIVYLIDNLSGEVKVVNPNEDYNFYLNSDDSDRLALLFKPQGADCEENTQNSSLDVQVITLDNGIQVSLDRPLDAYQVQVVDMLGQVVYNSSLIQNKNLKSQHLKIFENGAYLVNIIDDNGQIISAEKFVFIR